MAAGVIGALKIVLQAETAQFFRRLRRARGDLHKTGQAGTASGAALGAFTAALGGIAVAAGRRPRARRLNLSVLGTGMASMAAPPRAKAERLIRAVRHGIYGGAPAREG